MSSLISSEMLCLIKKPTTRLIWIQYGNSYKTLLHKSFLLWFQWDWKKCLRFFLNLEISQSKVYVCELWLTLTKAHSHCQHLDISAGSDLLVFLTPLMERAGSCWARVQKSWICLHVATSLPSPALPNILQTSGFSPCCYWTVLAAAGTIGSSVFTWSAPSVGDVWPWKQNLLDLSPSHPHFPLHPWADVACT